MGAYLGGSHPGSKPDGAGDRYASTCCEGRDKAPETTRLGNDADMPQDCERNGYRDRRGKSERLPTVSQSAGERNSAF